MEEQQGREEDFYVCGGSGNWSLLAILLAHVHVMAIANPGHKRKGILSRRHLCVPCELISSAPARQSVLTADMLLSNVC